MIQVEDYLARIGLSEPPKADYAGLAALQLAHLMTVPFETHDIHSGVRINCNEEAFLNKIILRKRGGFCYELNTAFAWLLRNLGFRVTLLSGRVARPDGGYGPEFDHMTLLVHLDEDYVVDVGFTNFSTTPMRLRSEPKTDLLGTSKVGHLENEDYAFSRFENEAWKVEYLFKLRPRLLQEFEGMCLFHETSPESPFIKKPLAAIYTKVGRTTISGNSLIILENNIRTTRDITDAEKFDLLNKQFGIICQ